MALLGLHTALAVRSLVRENPTVDEVIHLPAGVTYWQTGSFRLYHHNPPLVKLVAALPVLASRPVVDYRARSWTQEPPNKAAFAHEFMRDNAGRYFELFTRARLLMPVFSVIGGLVVFAWSRRLYGRAGRAAQPGALGLLPERPGAHPARDDRHGRDRPRRPGDVRLLALPEGPLLATRRAWPGSAWASPSSRSSA